MLEASASPSGQPIPLDTSYALEYLLASRILFDFCRRLSIRRGMRPGVYLALFVGFVAILGTLALPRASAAPVQNDGFGPVVGGALVPITDDDLFSVADLTTLLDPGGTSTKHYGPYTSTSPDSGTCGNDWATDTFDRHFTVRTNPDGTFLVVEQFKDGTFVTDAGPSPGACQTGPQTGTVESGINGGMHGYFLIPVAGSQTSNDPHCNALTMTDTGCDTATFVNTHFAGCAYPAPPCEVMTFFFHYAAGGNQALVENEWKNASDDRGGNHGDIRSTDL